MSDHMEASGKSRGLDGAEIKWIAMICMVCDHMAITLFDSAFWLRAAGRIAFPLYCLLLVEGFLYTKSRKCYFFTLLLFAFLSEVPFDLAVYGTFWYPYYQNVFFELAALLLMLCGLEWARRQKEGIAVLAFWGIIGAACACVWLIKADYHIIGIMMVLSLYYAGGDRKLQAEYIGAIGLMESLTYFGAGALAAVPVFLYNGKPGKRGNKYFFYWFYPVHFLVLAFMRWWMGLGN